MLSVSGNLNKAMQGPGVFLPVPDTVIEAHTDKQAAWKAESGSAINRRTIYAFVKRTLTLPLLETFDFCDLYLLVCNLLVDCFHLKGEDVFKLAANQARFSISWQSLVSSQSLPPWLVRSAVFLEDAGDR